MTHELRSDDRLVSKSIPDLTDSITAPKDAKIYGKEADEEVDSAIMAR